MATPASLSRGVSPPPLRKSSTSQAQNRAPARAWNVLDRDEHDKRNVLVGAAPSLAAVEAGQAQIRDHLEYFSQHFRDVSRLHSTSPRLIIDDFEALYRRNQHKHGRHFVVHQHDHPVSGTSGSSAVKGNHLIETASHATGSLLIWDTGEYEILPRKDKKARATDDESSGSDEDCKLGSQSQSERLCAAFQARHIRLRLHGTRLPPGYTISLRLPSANDRSRHTRRPKRKRRRLEPAVVRKTYPVSSDEDASGDNLDTTKADEGDSAGDAEDDAGMASDEDEDITIRANNAYPGATNTIGSVHQRNWFLTLDRRSSGFHKARGGPDQGRWFGGWEPFFVRGRDIERSVVTGRSADEVMEDEGVEKFVGRKMWRAILE